MNRLSSTARISVGLACLSMSVLLAAQTLGLVPDRRSETLKGRSVLCESLAINCSLLASKGDLPRIHAALQAIVGRNSDILSAGIRREDGELLVEVGDHATFWEEEDGGKSTDSHMFVPITAGNKLWGKLEIRFRPITQQGLLGYLNDPLIRLAGFMLVASAIAFYFYLRKMLRHLDPSKVVPDRVRSALDTLAEGLIVLDKDERIVLANRAFSKTLGLPAEKLQGRLASDLPWIKEQDGEKPQSFPWRQSMKDGTLQTGVILGLKGEKEELRTFKVNASPIVGGDGKYRGALASFSDVTVIEKNRVDLEKMLEMLKRSRDEISRQNEELQILATQDPLTGCLNRRSFFTNFETHWNSAKRHDQPLSCIMVDVDHFKSVNDQHGHAVGDRVLQQVASILQNSTQPSDLVCRYGGEEFCILLPNTGVGDAEMVAERCRRVIENSEFGEVSVTASLGVSAMNLGGRDPHEMLNQADQCLYLAKRNGRNRVINRHDIPEDFDFDRSSDETDDCSAAEENRIDVPFHAVTALVSALSYRDAATAEHSRRVADLCVSVAGDLMSVSDAYILEIAALLHDIGKIGVPDSILLKPGPLSEEEWKVMGVHDRIGVEILNSTFACEQLTEIVLYHHAWYGGSQRNDNFPKQSEIPIGARILSVADAYDAIVSDRVYRKGRAHEEGIAELRRCSGVQFDPDIVERFIHVVEHQDGNQLEELPPVSKQTALKIGIEIERLATALDDRDIFGMGALAGRLKATASKYNVPQIAQVAHQLEEAIADEPDLINLVQLTGELLELCRKTQNAYLRDDVAGNLFADDESLAPIQEESINVI